MADYQLRGVHGQTVATLATRILSGAIPEGASADGESTDLGSIIAPGRTGTGSTGTDSTGTESTGDGSDGTDQRAPARKRRRTTQAGLPVQARESEIRNESHH